MTDREKVIRSLETAVKNFERYSGDEYGREYDYARVEVETLEDAIALLKAQEPVEPTEPDEDNMRYCGACGSPVGYEVIEAPGIEYVQYSYCPNCGRMVKWDDA